MARLTTDPTDPDLTRGVDREPREQSKAYLIEENLGRPRVRPLRTSYVHVGPAGPKYALRDLTPEERGRYAGVGYVAYEPYPIEEAPVEGRFWKQEALDAVAAGGCGTKTTMSLPLAETYAVNPTFYGATYCVGCRKHLPVGEFRWDGDGEVVGS